MAPLCSLCQDNQNGAQRADRGSRGVKWCNEVQHDIFSYMMPFAPALAACDVDSVINGTIVFLKSRKLKQSVTSKCNLMPSALASVSYAVNSIINNTIIFPWLR